MSQSASADLRPGYVTITARLTQCATIALLLAVVTAGGSLAVRDVAAVSALHTRGKRAWATVISRAVVAPPTIYYAFPAEGQIVRDSARSERRLYPQFWTGRQFPVTYLPGSPRVHRVGSVPQRDVDVTLLVDALRAALPALSLCLLIACEFRSSAHELELVRRGMLVQGHVIGVRTLLLSRVSYAYEIEGATRRGACVADGFTARRMAAGCRVLVDPKRPARSRPTLALRWTAMPDTRRPALRLFQYRG